MSVHGFSPLRRLRAAGRDSVILLREFFGPLALFGLLFLGGGLLYYRLALGTPGQLDSPAEAIYIALTLTFLQASIPFPHEPYLQAFFFLMPLIGFVLLAQGITEFGTLFFNRRTRGKEWAMAIASMLNRHIILVGLGHLGFQVVENLHSIGLDVAVIEQNPNADLLTQAQAMDVPVIVDDAQRDVSLHAAGVERARAILLCTQNDSLNLQIAVKARVINPDINVVIRIFDHDFAAAIQKQFGFTALSASSISAPSFASAAAGVEMTRPITIHGQAMNLARLEVAPGSRLTGMSFGQVETTFNVSVVLWQHGEEIDFHPPGEALVGEAGTIAVLGEMRSIARVLDHNQGRRKRARPAGRKKRPAV
ncbi:MAG: potassium channel protein [Chloroflexi bacterium]|nr:potassium channel protein [Chloroflexota bacterium]